MEPLQLNLTEILKARIPSNRQRFIPDGIFGALERLIHQDELNEMLRVCHPLTGSAFANRLLEHLDIKVNLHGTENIPHNKRLIFASNHPLGGLDGISLIGVLGSIFGDDNIRFLVNDLLMNVKPLSNVFLPINKYGSQARHASEIINDAYASDMQLAIFPAGLVSRLQNGKIEDLKWQKAFVAKAIKYDRDIVPVHFIAHNSMRFYRTALWRKRLHIGVNIEQVLLPGELCKARGMQIDIVFGKPIPSAKLAALGANPTDIAAAIRKIVYSL